jgi:Proteasome subunit
MEFLVFWGPIIRRFFACSNEEKINQNTKGVCSSPISMGSTDILRIVVQMFRTAIASFYFIKVARVAAVMQEFTQSGGVRPFGVSLLICGWDKDAPEGENDPKDGDNKAAGGRPRLFQVRVPIPKYSGTIL